MSVNSLVRGILELRDKNAARALGEMESEPGSRGPHCLSVF
jgi:hypothetical protein